MNNDCFVEFFFEKEYITFYFYNKLDALTFQEFLKNYLKIESNIVYMQVYDFHTLENYEEGD